MKKIIYKTFISLIVILLGIAIYLSTIGIKTNKLNTKIISQIKKIDKDLDIKLNQLVILLDPFNLELNAKTFGANLIYKDRIIEIENIKSIISIKSFIDGKFSLNGLSISTKPLDIKNLMSFIRLVNKNPKIFIAEQFVKKGYLIADINLEFDQNGKIKDNYEIKGLVKDGKINFLKKYNLTKIDYFFEVNSETFRFNDINLFLNEKNIIVPQLIIKKKKDEYSISGKLNNKEISVDKKDIKKFFDEDLLGLDIQKIIFSSKSNFDFSLDKKLKPKNLNLDTEILLNNLELKNSLKLESFFPKIKENIIFENHKIKINYNKQALNISGKGNTFIQNNLDQIRYEISKNKEQIDFNIILDITKNAFFIDILNFKKLENSNLELKIKGKKNPKKELVFNEISLKENNNKISFKKLILSNNYKLKDIKLISIDILDKENLKNEIQISKRNKFYLIKGSSFSINKIVDKFLDSNNNKKLFFSNKKFKFEFDIEKIYFNKNSRIKNLKGFLILDKNEIKDLSLISNFSDQKKIKFTIKTKDSEKITTLFSHQAKPLVDRYKFIKGFNEGSLDFYSIKKGNQSKSTLKIYDFKLKELPALTKLLTLASLQGIADLLSGEGIRFTEFEMNFTNEDQLITINEIYAIGPAISVLMNGYIEKNKLISLRGTLVPATTLNKTIGSIPFLGEILVGKKTGEGVFGVSFKIKGPPKKLETTVNPIKTLTPRFITRTLEKIKKN